MHMCITTRASWEPVAQLNAAGINALTVDAEGNGTTKAVDVLSARTRTGYGGDRRVSHAS